MKRIKPIAILAIIILIEHFTLGRLLKNWELTRWTIGILTVLGWSYPIALEEYGAYGEDIWQIITTGFFVAGSTKIGLVLIEKKA
jgi:hypothetical protein